MKNTGEALTGTVSEGRGEAGDRIPVFTGGHQILIVDDQESIRDILSRMLSSAGFHVHSAGNGAEALRLFSQSCFALVLTDFHMPGMDGLTLAAKIRSLSPTTPVILMTGSDALPGSEKKRPVICILPKPFRWQDLTEAVESALGG